MRARACLRRRRKIAHRRFEKLDALLFRLGEECGDEGSIFDHMPEGLARLDLAEKCEKALPHGVFKPAVRNDHVEDGLRWDFVPDSEPLKQMACCGNDCRCSPLAGGAGESGIDDRYVERGTQSLAQRQRQRQTDNAGAANENVDLLSAAGY